jgi:cytochrome c-type biogenesis protein CcsB
VEVDALTRFSNLAFGVTLALYLGAAVAFFHHLAFHRGRVLVAARVLTAAGLAAHLASVVSRGLAADRVPWGNMYEYVSVVSLLLVALFLALERRWRIDTSGGFVLGVAVAAMGAATLIYVPPGPLVPALNSYWLRIHVVMAMLGSALFTLGFVLTVLYLWQDRRERRSASASVQTRRPAMVAAGGDHAGDHLPAEESEVAGPPLPEGRLPAAATLDRLAYRTIVFAFPIWTLAVIFGAIWAEEAWGRYWGWDPKEVWSFVTWVVFAGYLHARATVGWRGRRAAVLAVIGFLALVFNLVVVNTVIAGLHSYAT